MLCPKCSQTPTSIQTQYGIRNQCCDLWSWGKGTPLVDHKTHEARKAAHAAFDVIWRNRYTSRSKAYTMLAERLGIPKEQCHMKLMDATTAQKVVSISKDMLHELHK